MAEDWNSVKSEHHIKIMMNEARTGRILAFISLLYAPLIVILHILVTVSNLSLTKRKKKI